MDAKYEQILTRQFPKIFSGYHSDPKDSCMAWGMLCGNGWFDILFCLCFHIQMYLNHHPEVEQVVATQVKEKFGGLRFYYVGGDSEIDKMVEFIDALSYQTCEECGSHDNVSQTKGWISTLCEKCLEARKK